MKKWIIIAVVLLVVALFAVILIFGSRFLSLYASMDSDREAAPPSSEVESYMSAHWPQYESIYDSSTQTLQLNKQTTMEIDSARKVGGKVYVDALAPETYLENVSAIAVDVISHCSCPRLKVILSYISVEGETIFSVASDGSIYTCWEAES